LTPGPLWIALPEEGVNMNRSRTGPVTAVAALLAALFVAPAAHAQAPPPVTCPLPPVPSTTQPGYTVADPRCELPGAPFVPLTDAAGAPVSTVYTGIDGGAAYRVEKPLNWNGELVLYAHGYRGQGSTVFVDNPGALRAHYIAKGFAWAASSYQTNGYDVGQGVRDSQGLIRKFAAVTGTAATSVYLTGASMGGHITAVAIERYRHTFAGAMPYCGSIGDTELYDYFLDANVIAAALTRNPIEFPAQEPPAEWQAAFRQSVKDHLALLGTGLGTGNPTFTPLGREWGEVVERRSGGDRPGFDSAWAYWNARPGLTPNTDVPFLFGVYPGLSAGTAGIAPGNVTDNTRTLYRIDDNRWLSRAEIKINREVLRVRATAPASRDLTGIPVVKGDPRIPVMSLHTIGDLFVPLSMEQIYAREVAAHRQSKLLVSRAIRALGHCEFTPAELQAGFDDLVSWARSGKRPAGDDIGSRRTVARPDFGCRFTVGVRSTFVAPACPAA
jgi:hypothetical protein